MNAEKEHQHARMAQIAEEMNPDWVASFSAKGMDDSINDMKVKHRKTGAILFTSPDRCYWTVETVKDKSDEEIRRLLLAWMSGKTAP